MVLFQSKTERFRSNIFFSGQLRQGKGTSGLFYTLGVTWSPKQLPGYSLTSLFCSKITTINSSKKGFKSFNPPYILGAHHIKCTLSSNHCPHPTPQYFPTLSPPLSYGLHLSICIHNIHYTQLLECQTRHLHLFQTSTPPLPFLNLPLSLSFLSSPRPQYSFPSWYFLAVSHTR